MMNNDNITIQQRSQDFAVRVIKAYTKINKKNHFNSAAVILSKQFLRSGTSIGANIRESIYAQSNRDFISKYSIAYNYIPLYFNNKQQQQWSLFFLLSKVTIT